MQIKLSEESTELGLSGSTQWYELKVRVESDKPEDIEHVEYFMQDASISDPVIVSSSPLNDFEIQAQSWRDNVPVTATVIFKDQNISPIVLTRNNPFQINEV